MGHIDQIKSEFPYVVTVDVGGSFGQPPPRTGLENTLYICNTYQRGGYDVLNVGEYEARFGTDFLREREKETGVEFISANLVRAGEEKPILHPTTLRQVGGLRVGFLGLLDVVTPLPAELDEAGVDIRDPLAAAAEFVPRLRKKCGMLVVAAYMSMPRARELAQRVEGIDLIICRWSRLSIQPERVGSTIIAPAGQRAGQIGELDLMLTETGTIDSFMGEVVRLQELGPRDDAMDREIRELMDAQTRARLAQQQQAREEHEAQETARRDSLAAVLERQQPEPPPPAISYVGGTACEPCHQEVFNSWAEGPHAHAFATLAQTEDWSKASCLKCHTTGFGKVSHSREGLPAPEFWNVQCEACHGPGSAHAASPGSMEEVSPEVCVSCHDQEWSPEFDFAGWRARIPHAVGSVSGD